MRKDEKIGPAGEASEERIALRDGSKPRVLLAEDSPAARILTAALLKRMGCNVDVVEHGEEAVTLAQTFSYDLIILDIEMPVMDGVVAAREIKALGGAAGKTPIVALSAFLADARKLNAWKGAFDGTLAKPAGREQLRRAINDVLASRFQAPEQTKFDHDPTVLIDHSAFSAVREKINPESWQSLLEMAIREMRDLAVLMQAAQARNDRASLRRGSHKLKGIASTFAAARLACLAESAEESATDQPIEDIKRQIESISSCIEATAIAFTAAATAAA